jgi:hypothetical protein
MTVTLVDSYSQTNQDYAFVISAGSGRYYTAGQAFTAIAGTLDSATFYVERVGVSSGNTYAVVYAMTGTFGTTGVPTGSPLATSDPVDVITIGTAYALVTFVFSGANRIALTNGTHYVVQFQNNNGDATHNVYLGCDNSSSTHPGNSSRHADTGSWGSGGQDVCFYVYADVAGSTSIAKVSGVADASIAKVAGVALASIGKVAGVA